MAALVGLDALLKSGLESHFQSLLKVLKSTAEATQSNADARHAEVMAELAKVGVSLEGLHTITNNSQKNSWFKDRLDAFAWVVDGDGGARRPLGLTTGQIWAFVSQIPIANRPDTFPTTEKKLGAMLTYKAGMMWYSHACGVGRGSVTFYWSSSASTLPDNVREHPRYKAPVVSSPVVCDTETVAADSEDSGDDDLGASSDSSSTSNAAGDSPVADKTTQMKAKHRHGPVVADFLRCTRAPARGRAAHTELVTAARHWEGFLESERGGQVTAAQQKADEDVREAWAEYKTEHEHEGEGDESGEGEEAGGEHEHECEHEDEGEGEGGGEERRESGANQGLSLVNAAYDDGGEEGDGEGGNGSDGEEGDGDGGEAGACGALSPRSSEQGRSVHRPGAHSRQQGSTPASSKAKRHRASAPASAAHTAASPQEARSLDGPRANLLDQLSQASDGEGIGNYGSDDEMAKTYGSVAPGQPGY
jgi:hypothetical protein